MNLKKVSVGIVLCCFLGLSGGGVAADEDAPSGDAPPSAPTVPTPEVAASSNNADSNDQEQRFESSSIPVMLRGSIDPLYIFQSLLVGLGEGGDGTAVIVALERGLIELEAIRRELEERVSSSTSSYIDPTPGPIIGFDLDSELGVVQGARDYLSGLGIDLDDLEEEFTILGDGDDYAAVVRFIDEVTEVCNLSRDEQTWLAAAMGGGRDVAPSA